MAKTFNAGGGGGGTGGLKLESIEIITPPSKTTYKAGESFDPSGISVQANYSYGITAEVTGYTYSPTVLTDGVTEVIISYAEGRTVKTASQPVTVIPVLAGLEITTPPTKTSYLYLESFDPAGMVVSAVYSDGNKKAVTGYTTNGGQFTQLGEQTVQVTYTEDGITKETSVSVTVSAISMSIPSQSGVLTYTGAEQSPVWTGYDSNKMTVSGDTSGTNAGVYSAVFTPQYGYQWTDGTDTEKQVSWSIGKATPGLTATPSTLNLSAQQSTGTVTIEYDGDGTLSAASSAPSVASVALNGNILTVTGLDTGTATVTVSASEGDNYVAKSVTISVSMQAVQYLTAVPAQNGTMTYNGSAQSPAWSNYDPDQLEISGDTSGTNAGTYTAVFTPKPGYAWSDGSESKSVEWTIDRATLTAVPSQSGTLTYTGSEQTPVWNDYNTAQLTMGGTTSGTNAGTYTATFTPTANYQWSDGTKEGKAVTWKIGKVMYNFYVSPSTVTIGIDETSATVKGLAKEPPSGIRIGSYDSTLINVSAAGNVITLEKVEGANGTTTVTVYPDPSSEENWYYSPSYAGIKVSVASETVHIYGATWDGSSTTAFTRTDDSALFADPVPAVGPGSGSSPFDSLLPWSGMNTVGSAGDGTGNSLVSIPKFWVKVSHSPFKVQIADGPVDGFQVSPAHRDRGDGKGERDVVYIGRYECNASYQSRSGQAPGVSKSLGTFRSGIKAIGTGYYQADYALQLTLFFLYLVEFADWNSQSKIGRGNVDSGAVINTGGTELMEYHTGRAAGTDGNVAIQYRWIENLWGNVLEWRDGIIFSDTAICTYNNPTQFVDTYGGTGGTVRSNARRGSGGWIKAWGYDAADNTFIYPSTVGGSDTTYVPDYCSYSSGVRGLYVCGGYYNYGTNAGLFCLSGYYAPSNTDSSLGSRLMKLP